MTTIRHDTPSSVRTIEVIQVITRRGAGVEGDPVRIVLQYWTPEGALLAEYDTHTDDGRGFNQVRP